MCTITSFKPIFTLNPPLEAHPCVQLLASSPSSPRTHCSKLIRVYDHWLGASEEMNCNSIYVPPEVLDNIVQRVPNSSLKSFRQSCKQASVAGALKLFRIVYVSRHGEDWDKLRAISEHPLFSQMVEETIYDTSAYTWGMTKRSYYLSLFSQGLNEGALGVRNLRRVSSPKYSKAALQRGYKEYKKEYETQRDRTPLDQQYMQPDMAHQSPLFSKLPQQLVCLVTALGRLPRIKALAVMDLRYDKHRWEHDENTYFVAGSSDITEFSFSISHHGRRGFETVKLHPTPWERYRGGALRDQEFRWLQGFRLLCQAVSMAKIKSIRSFKVGAQESEAGIPLTVFNARDGQYFSKMFMPLQRIDIDLTFPRYYRDFHLDEADQQKSPAIAMGRLTKALQRSQVYDLSLNFNLSSGDLIVVTQMFNALKDSRLPNLRSFTLKRAIVAEQTFLDFMISHSTLRTLICEQVEMDDHEPTEHLINADYADDIRLGPWHRTLKRMAEAKIPLQRLSISLGRMTPSYSDASVIYDARNVKGIFTGDYSLDFAIH